MSSNAEDIAVEAAELLTDTQRRRLIERLSGKSLQEIATQEGRSKSAIAESLKTPAIRETLTILGRQMTAHVQDPKTGEEVDLINALLRELASIALNATRAVVVNTGLGMQSIQYVKDNRTRLDAIGRLLDLARPEGAMTQATAPETTTEVQRTLTATETRRTRTRPARNAGEPSPGHDGNVPMP